MKARGYMGGDIAGGCDVDDADRELGEGKPEMIRLRIVLETQTAYGVEEKAISESQDLTRGHVQAAINWLQNAWKERVDPDFPAPPMTVYARGKCKAAFRKMRERFDDIEKAWGDACADTLGEGMQKVKECLAVITELCSAIETQAPSVTNEFVGNARKRARDFLESVGET